MAFANITRHAFFRLAVYSFAGLALLFHALLLSACIPPVAGANSTLRQLFLFALGDGRNDTHPILVGYYSICFNQSCVTTPFKKETEIGQHLGGSNPDLLRKAVLLQSRVLTEFATVSGVFLVLACIVLALLQTLRKTSGMQKSAGSLRNRLIKALPTVIKIFAFISMAWILLSAVAVYQQIAAIKWTTRLWGANQEIKFGVTGMAMHWLALGFTLIFVVGVSLMLHGAKDRAEDEKEEEEEEDDDE